MPLSLGMLSTPFLGPWPSPSLCRLPPPCENMFRSSIFDGFCLIEWHQAAKHKWLLLFFMLIFDGWKKTRFQRDDRPEALSCLAAFLVFPWHYVLLQISMKNVYICMCVCVFGICLLYNHHPHLQWLDTSRLCHGNYTDRKYVCIATIDSQLIWLLIYAF